MYYWFGNTLDCPYPSDRRVVFYHVVLLSSYLDLINIYLLVKNTEIRDSEPKLASKTLKEGESHDHVM